jgi:hypothetical protein
MDSVKAWRTSVALVALAAVALRVPGLDYGLPAVYNPDEIAILNRALGLVTNRLDPGNFVYPSLYFYALLAWEGLGFVVALILGTVQSGADFERAFFIDPTWHFLTGRAFTVVCAALTVVATAHLGARLYDRRVGLVAALFLAVAPFAVRDAHYIKHDVPVTLLVVLALAAAARLIVRPEARSTVRPWIVAGGLAGLAATTHYYAVFVAIPVAFAAVAGRRGESAADGVRHGALAGAAALVAFAAGSPFLLLSPTVAWADITANRAIVMDRAVEAAGGFGAGWRYAEMLAAEAMGWPVFVLAAIGAILAVHDDWRRSLAWLLFPVAFLAFLANTVPAGRYLNPILPVVAIAAGYATSRLAAALPRPPLATALVAFVAAFPAVTDSLRIDAFFRQADTRALAAAVIEREIPSGTGIMIQPYSVALRPSREALVRALRTHLGSEEQAPPRFRGQLALTPYPEPAYDLVWLGDGGQDKDKIYLSPSRFTSAAGLTPLRDLNIAYVVLNQERGTNAAFEGLERALEREGRLVRRIVPWQDRERPDRAVEPFLHNTDRRIDQALERPGPVVEIWAVR